MSARPTWRRLRGHAEWQMRYRWDVPVNESPLVAVVVKEAEGFAFTTMGTVGWRANLDDALAAACALLGVPP